MKTNPSKMMITLALGALLGLTAGCGTTDTLAKRIDKNREIYAGLSAEEKKQIQDGVITVGFSPEMVMMALGKPERILPGKGPGEEDWIYVNSYSRNGHSLEMSSKLESSFDRMGGTTAHKKFYDPAVGNVRATFQLQPDLADHDIRAESAIKVHVKFTEGTVADIQIVSDNKG